MTNLENTLRSAVDADIHFDTVHCHVYSVDASIYELVPQGIVIPKSREALIHTVKIAKQFNISVTPRGAATGITGSCLGHGIIIDTSKYLNKILEINYEQEYAICEPGVVQDALNAELAKNGYRLGPDTSTGNRATIGGMFANNAAGARSLFFGTMADHIEHVELVLSNGEVLQFQNQLTEQEWKAKRNQKDTEGRIYNALWDIKEKYSHEIKNRFPHIPRRVSGYNLEALINNDNLNVCRLLSGSEGTLGIATKIKVRICKKPKVSGICIIHFQEMILGMQAIEKMLSHHPMAIEMIDDKIIELGRQSPTLRGKINWLQGYPKALFIAEFQSDNQSDLEAKLNAFAKSMQQQNIGSAQTLVTEPELIANVWELRKSGLGLLLSRRTYSRAIGFIEDLTVAPEQLASFMIQFLAYLKSKSKEAGVYGHVGSGCMHIRPFINLRSSEDVQLMKQMMEDVSDIVLKHGGALSGEHGDGLIRSWLNKKMFGKQLYDAFVLLKQAFDPDGLMNPGKITQGPPVDENLRLSPATKQVAIQTFLDFSAEGGFELAVDLCNGNGQCRKKEKTMCPSFQASNDEFHTTRARAQSLRAIINGKMPLKQLTSKGMYDVMDLCIECKGCKTECPSEVDMAKMKAEFLYQYQKANGTPLRSTLFGRIDRLNRINSVFPRLYNWWIKTALAKTVFSAFGITPERQLPALALKRFSVQIKKQKKFHSDKKVVLFNDTFTEFHHPEIGLAAVTVLEALGFEVIIPSWHCCGRPAISKGLLQDAKEMAKKVVDQLVPFAKQGFPIIGLEPSCILTLKDDYKGLLNSDELAIVVNMCTTFDEFVDKHKEKLRFDRINKTIKVHGHCHQKALVGMKPTLSVLKSIPECHVEEIDSGCCGMAGSFGYEKEHYTFSMKIGELKLFPAVHKNEDAVIIADGVSCRSQIDQGTNRKAMHLAEFLAEIVTKSIP